MELLEYSAGIDGSDNESETSMDLDSDDASEMSADLSDLVSAMEVDGNAESLEGVTDGIRRLSIGGSSSSIDDVTTALHRLSLNKLSCTVKDITTAMERLNLGLVLIPENAHLVQRTHRHLDPSGVGGSYWRFERGLDCAVQRSSHLHAG
jgi:hypothetical protein